MEGEYVMKEIVKFGVPPDIAICKALTNGYCKEMYINRAELLLGFFARELQIFHTESYNTLVVLFELPLVDQLYNRSIHLPIK
ncbi:pentatricopeptide repeat-containing protein [Quercus suber]|uniref:Pentatricopeptide repeat-containing protein n=1 Tax=Quercus suber TaxID=58331 RepID=A0AAW0K1G0_QUESU